MQDSHITYMVMLNSNKNSWCRIIQYLIKYTNLDQEFHLKSIILNPKTFLEKFTNRLGQNFLNFWKKEKGMITNTKLDFYKNVKNQFSSER